MKVHTYVIIEEIQFLIYETYLYTKLFPGAHGSNILTHYLNLSKNIRANS